MQQQQYLQQMHQLQKQLLQQVLTMLRQLVQRRLRRLRLQKYEKHFLNTENQTNLAFKPNPRSGLRPALSRAFKCVCSCLTSPFHGIRTAQARPLPSIVAAMQIFVKTGKQLGFAATSALENYMSVTPEALMLCAALTVDLRVAWQRSCC